MERQGSQEAEGPFLWSRLKTRWPQDSWTAPMVAAGFTIKSCFPRKQKKGSSTASYDLTSEITKGHFCRTLSAETVIKAHLVSKRKTQTSLLIKCQNQIGRWTCQMGDNTVEIFGKQNLPQNISYVSPGLCSIYIKCQAEGIYSNS